MARQEFECQCLAVKLERPRSILSNSLSIPIKIAKG